MSRRVLVVDDSELARAVLARSLRGAGFTVLEASDGAEAAIIALREAPDIVVTDLEMPVMDGYQLLHVLKSEPGAASIPVLILTSHDEAASRYWGLQTGADGFLSKDRTATDLVSTVNDLIEQSRQRPRPQRTALPQGPLDVLARVAHHLDQSLLQATLVNALLAEGMRGENLADAARAALAKLAEVVDASFLALGIAEPETVTLSLLIPEPLSLLSADQATSAVLERMRVPSGAVVDVHIDGDREGGAPGAPIETMSFLELPLREHTGTLAVLPRNQEQFESSTRPLLASLLPHLALLLDNARLAQRLREMSTLDGLTRLLNHRSIHERLSEEVGRAVRHDQPLSAIVCDLDRFKSINDTHGHLAGDTALRAAVQNMRRAMRHTDVLGRYGGEEFLVILPGTDLGAARRTAERLRESMASRSITLTSGAVLTLTASFGAACLDELGDPRTADALVALADARMYEAKAAGRNCVRP